MSDTQWNIVEILLGSGFLEAFLVVIMHAIKKSNYGKSIDKEKLNLIGSILKVGETK